MKKLCFVLSVAAIVGSASAKDLYSSAETHPYSAVGVSLADPLQLPPANWNVRGLRLDIFYGRNYDLYGLDIGLFGRCDDDLLGAAIDGASWIEGDMYGFQFGALFNIVNGDMRGFQLATLVNRVHNAAVGAQIACVNHNGAFFGGQLGLVNWNKGISSGLQFGLVNAGLNDFNGWSFGVVNYAMRQRGLQFGFVNVIDEVGSGLQIGAFNAAPKFEGVQIGFINVLGNGEMPIMPVFNACF